MWDQYTKQQATCSIAVLRCTQSVKAQCSMVKIKNYACTAIKQVSTSLVCCNMAPRSRFSIIRADRMQRTMRFPCSHSLKVLPTRCNRTTDPSMLAKHAVTVTDL